MRVVRRRVHGKLSENGSEYTELCLLETIFHHQCPCTDPIFRRPKCRICAFCSAFWAARLPQFPSQTTQFSVSISETSLSWVESSIYLVQTFSQTPFKRLINVSAGDLHGVLYNSTVFSGDGVFQAAELRQEHVRVWDGEIDTLWNRDFDGEKREDNGVEDRGEWLLRALADVAGNVVPWTLGRRQQGGGRQRRQDCVAAYALARHSCSQRPPTSFTPHYSGNILILSTNCVIKYSRVIFFLFCKDIRAKIR